MFGISPIITKEDLFKVFTEEEIFNYYGVPITTKLFCSPFRNDRNPTCKLFRKAGKLFFKDFGSDWYVDCIGLVQRLFHLSFKSAIIRIYNDIKGKIRSKVAVKTLPKIEATEDCRIEVKVRKIQDKDTLYWNSFGILSTTLEKFNVYPCEWVRVNNNVVYTDSRNSLAYAYWLGKENGLDRFKIYFPDRKKFRFLSNTSIIQGIKQLPKEYDKIVIQKSMKDVMLLSQYGINSIAFSGETAKPSKELLERILNKYDKAYVWYDNDEAGRMAIEYFEGFHKIITEEYKDATDYRKYKGQNAFEDYLTRLQLR